MSSHATTEKAGWVSAVAGHTVTRMAASRAATEICSAGVFLGATHLLEHAAQCKPAKRMLAKVIEPFLPAIDKVADGLPALESDAETASRQAMEKSERAYHYADLAFDNTVTFGLCLGAQAVLMKTFDNALGVHIPGAENRAYVESALWDRGVHLGGVAVLAALAPVQSEQMQDALQSVLQKGGVEEESARCISRNIVVCQLPNIAGAAAGIAALYGAYGKGKS